MKKIILLTITAIFAAACIFTACKKEDLTNDFKSNKLNRDVYDESQFDRTATYWSQTTLDSYRNQLHFAIEYQLEAGWPIPNICYPINNWFGDFHVRAENGQFQGREYSSFCSHYISDNLGGANGIPYFDKTDLRFPTNEHKNHIIAALSYIHDTYGSVQAWPELETLSSTTIQGATKLLAQAVLWNLLHEGVWHAHVTGDVYGNMSTGGAPVGQLPATFVDEINAAIDYIIAMAEGPNPYVSPRLTAGGTTVTDIVFLAQDSYQGCEVAFNNDWQGLKHCQPQMVPLTSTIIPPSPCIDVNVPYWIADYAAPGSPQWVAHGSIVYSDATISGNIVSKEIYKFTVRTSTGASYQEFSSFCANSNSNALSGLNVALQAGTLAPTQKAKILNALNYINNTYGSFDGWMEDKWMHYVSVLTVESTTRVLSQMAIWMIMDPNMTAIQAKWGQSSGNIGGNFDSYDFLNSPHFVNVMAAANGPKVSGEITDLLYLVGPDYPNDVISRQPQIVPLVCPEDDPETVVVSGLNWNNGTISDKDGANGAGLNQFTIDSYTMKNNKNYLTPVNFGNRFADKAASAAPSNKEEKGYFTVTKREVTINGKYEKIYFVSAAIYQSGIWKGYAGTIIVDNPGGNDNNQKLNFYRVF